MSRESPSPRSPQLDLAGHLAVAFVNTASARQQNRQLGARSYEQLVAWALQAGVLEASEAERLNRWASEQPEEAAHAYTRAAELRSALFRIYLEVHRERPLPAADLALVSEAWAAAMSSARLVPGETGVTFGWADDADAPDRVLWPVLKSVSEFLISLEGRRHVRQCAARPCRLFFVDRTPSARRKWCDWKACGHRVSSLAHYHRTGKRSPRPGSWR